MLTCARCGQQGDPPSCDHFAQPWSMEQIADAHRQIKAMTWTPEIPEAQRQVRVHGREIDFDNAMVSFRLSCGHHWTFQIASCPIVSVRDTLGFPELGDAVTCPECGPWLH